MKKALIALVLVLVAGVAGSLVASTAEPARDGAFGFEVDLAPLADTPNGYRCQATFRDLATNDVLAAPQLVFLKGSDARTQTEIPGTGQVAALTVQVSDGGVLTYELEVRAGARVVGRHKATVTLEG